MSRGGISIAGPLDRADASLTSAKDIPATPKIGAAFLRRFGFETCLVRDIAKSFHMFERILQRTKMHIHIQGIALPPQRITSKAKSDVTRRTSRYVLLNSKGDITKMDKRSRCLPP